MAFSPLPYIHPSLFCVCVSIFSRFQVSIARLAWTHFEAPSHVQCLKSYVVHCVRLLQTCIHYHWILPMCPHFAQGCLMAWNQFAAVRGDRAKEAVGSCTCCTCCIFCALAEIDRIANSKAASQWGWQCREPGGMKVRFSHVKQPWTKT